MTVENITTSAVAGFRKGREQIIAALAAYIARPDNVSPSEAHTEFAATLFDATLAVFAGGSPFAVSLPGDLDRQLISRFGDGLSPILKDAVPDLPSTAFSRMSDSYWSVIKRGLAPTK